MVFELLFGILLLVIVVFVGLRILGNVVTGVAMIALVMVASFVIAGSWPDLQSIPVIGPYIPSLPTTASAIGLIKNQIYNVDILGVSNDTNNGLIVIVGNTGRLDITSLTVRVDNQTVQILNTISYPIKSKQAVALQTDWKSSYNQITVSTGKASASYP